MKESGENIIQDIETLTTAQSEAVLSLDMEQSGLNPVQLACMANPRVEVLQAHFPFWVESGYLFYGNTPLHLAVKYSRSVDF